MNGLRPYQIEAVESLLAKPRSLVLASVGAGKTAVALSALARVGRKAVVIAPKRVAEETWPVEAAKWAPGLSIAICTGTPKKREAALNARSDILVINYDVIPWFVGTGYQFDALVLDELTMLKNPSGQRFKALYKATGKTPYVWGLTGSFTSNGLEDAFGQCKIVGADILGDKKTHFLNEYFYLFNRDYMDWRPKAGSLERVMARVKPHAFVLESAAYKCSLPPLNIVEIPFDLADRKPYETMKRSAVLGDVVAESAASLVLKLQQLSSGFLYTNGAAHAYNQDKMQALHDLITENQYAPHLVFYKFQSELDALKAKYPHAQTLDDPDAIERWNRGEIELLLAHPQSARFGLNLQYGGNKIVFYSLPWSLTDFEQAIGRLHRSGQTQHVFVYCLLARNTVDLRVLEALRDKQELSNAALKELLND